MQMKKYAQVSIFSNNNSNNNNNKITRKKESRNSKRVTKGQMCFSVFIQRVQQKYTSSVVLKLLVDLIKY